MSAKPIKLTLAIKDIMKATGCSPEQAKRVESEMNGQGGVDWSEDDYETINREARQVYNDIYGNRAEDGSIMVKGQRLEDFLKDVQALIDIEERKS